VPADQPDAIRAYGQTIPVSAPAGATEIGFLGSAASGGTTGSHGTVTVTYTDGSTSTAALGFADWTLDAGKATVYPGNVTVATLPYRDEESGLQQTLKVYLFAETIPVDSSKTVASITLPSSVNTGSIGILAMSAG
jgi:hypothetical protein